MRRKRTDAECESLQTAMKRMRQNNDKIILFQSVSSWRCASRKRDRPPQVILDCPPVEERLKSNLRLAKLTRRPRNRLKLRNCEVNIF